MPISPEEVQAVIASLEADKVNVSSMPSGSIIRLLEAAANARSAENEKGDNAVKFALRASFPLEDN